MSKNNKSLIKATRKRIAKQQTKMYIHTDTQTHRPTHNAHNNTENTLRYNTNVYFTKASSTYRGRCRAFPLPVLEHVAKNDVNISRGEHKIHHNNIQCMYVQCTQDTYDTNDDWCVLVCTTLSPSPSLHFSLVPSHILNEQASYACV